jgi:DNA polymerase-1
MSAPLLCLLDSSVYVFRAFYSLPSSIVDPSGRPVNAVRGFATTVLQLLESECPSHFLAAFDESLDSSFRNESYPAYKSSREPAPPELLHQFAACREFIEACGLVSVADERFEADDFIATAWARFGTSREGLRGLIVTNDKDLCQLVGARLEWYDLAKDRRLDDAGVVEKLGVRPAQVPDFLGLAGDSVDDIPGVPGVGPKTACALLSEFQDLESLYRDLDRVAELGFRGAKSLGAKLELHRERALLSKQLATVSCEAPLGAGELGTLAVGPPRPEALAAWAEHTGLDRLAERALARSGRPGIPG